jgi:hypothetical protein
VSRTKKTEIVDFVIVNSVMWWGSGERGKSHGVGSSYQAKDHEWMGICHHEQETGLPSKSGSFIILQGV